MINIKYDKWTIKNDSKQYIIGIYGKSKDKDGNEIDVFRAEAYYRTMDGVLNYILEHAVRETEIDTLSGYVETFKSECAKISKALEIKK